MYMKIAIVLNSGTPIKRKIGADKIICCDGGYNLCPNEPDVIVGDFDSVKGSVPENIKTIFHNPHKNATDGELAVYYAKEEFDADEIEFYGVLGGRYDHTLGNFAIMKLCHSLGMKATSREENLDIYFAQGKFRVSSDKGDLISVVPFGGDVLVENYENLEYPLVNLLLTSADSRGISNVSLGGEVELNICKGCALVFHYHNI